MRSIFFFPECVSWANAKFFFSFLIIQYAFTWLHWAYYKLYFQENTVFILKQMKALHLKCDQNISFMCHWGKFKEYFICNQNVTIISMRLR